MAANETTVPTESLKTSSHKYVKKIAVQLRIKCRIEKFEALSTKPGGGSLWSEGVSSELVPGAEWKLEIYPNGESGEERGNIGLYLHLTGQMTNKKESLDASYQLYLLNGSDGMVDSIGRPSGRCAKRT